MTMVPRREDAAKRPTSARAGRGASIPKTTGMMAEEDWEIIAEIKVDHDDRRDPDDPTEADERLAPRQTRSRKGHDP